MSAPIPPGSWLFEMPLLHVTQNHVKAMVVLQDQAAHGFELRAAWLGRQPILINVWARTAPVNGASIIKRHPLMTSIAAGNELYWQKNLKSWGVRIATAARKPLRFERVQGMGLVHLAPAFHHLAVCGAHKLGRITDASASCRACILRALTPAPSTDSPAGQFHPYGRVQIRDAELWVLRETDSPQGLMRREMNDESMSLPL